MCVHFTEKETPLTTFMKRYNYAKLDNQYLAAHIPFLAAPIPFRYFIHFH